MCDMENRGCLKDDARDRDRCRKSWRLIVFACSCKDLGRQDLNWAGADAENLFSTLAAMQLSKDQVLPDPLLNYL